MGCDKDGHDPVLKARFDKDISTRLKRLVEEGRISQTSGISCHEMENLARYFLAMPEGPDKDCVALMWGEAALLEEKYQKNRQVSQVLGAMAALATTNDKTTMVNGVLMPVPKKGEPVC